MLTNTTEIGTALSRVCRKRPFAIHAVKRLVLDECNRMTRVCYVT